MEACQPQRWTKMARLRALEPIHTLGLTASSQLKAPHVFVGSSAMIDEQSHDAEEQNVPTVCDV